MTTAEPGVLPGPGTWAAINRIRRDGFLSAVGHFWRRYGDTFRIRLGPRSLVIVMHPDAVRRVSIEHRVNYDKGRSYDGARRYLVGDGLVASTGDLWRRQRKLLAPFFTPRGIQAYVPAMLREAKTVRQRWQQLAKFGETVDMGEEMMRITAAVILRTMFSTDSDDDVVTLKHDIEQMIAYVTTREQGLPVPDWVRTPRRRAYLAARHRVDAYVDRLITERRALSEDEWPEDLLSQLMRARDPETGHAMSEQLLRDETVTTFIAGHETTARVLTATWLALAANPVVEERLHRELSQQLGNGDPTPDDLHRLPYALQVVKEVMRLYPPAPFYVRDAIEDDVIDGYRIPAGSAVMVSPYYTHRHPEFWPDSERFQPDRWTRESQVGRHPAAYHPFALGPRVCIGNNFSLLESHLLLVLLARDFAPRLITGYAPDWKMAGVLVLSGGLPMTIVARTGPGRGRKLTERRVRSVPLEC